MANVTDLVPVDRNEFAGEITPCLELTAPTGMDGQARRMWLNAAYKALDGIPIALLKRGAAAALAKADHPSKIVPTIMKEIGEDWAWRKRMQTPVEIHVPALPDHSEDPERAEVAKLMSSLARKLEAKAA